MTDIRATGLGTGIDVQGIVDGLVAAERTPVANRLNLQEARTNAELSALGQLKSALSTFRDSLAGLRDIDGFQKRSVSVGNDAKLTASATTTAVPGTYQIDVQRLATGQKLASGAFADAATPVGSGTLTITVNGQAVAIAIDPEANTLAGIRNAINAAPGNPGVEATIINADDGARLIVSSRETGASQAMTITASGGDGGLAALTYAAGGPDNGLTELETAQDAVVLIDGFTVNSDRNTVANAIDGVSIQLSETTPDGPVELKVALDRNAARASVGGLVNAYNEVIGVIANVTRFDAESGEAAALLGDPIARDVKENLRREIGSVVGPLGATFRTLVEVGVTTNVDGTLSVDDTRLSAAIDTNFDAVGRLFAGDGGIAGRLDAAVGRALGSAGSIELRETGLKDRLEIIGDRRTALEERLEIVRARLLNQFNAMDRLVSQLQNTSSFLTRQLGA